MKNNALALSLNIITKVTKWIIILSIAAMAVMLVINVVEVVASKWFHWSFSGSLELTEQFMVIVSILPIAYIALERGHINITMVTDRLSVLVRHVLQIIGYILGIATTVFFSWRVFVQMQYVIRIGSETQILDYPIWITNLVIVIAFGLLAITWLLLLIKTIVTGPPK